MIDKPGQISKVPRQVGALRADHPQKPRPDHPKLVARGHPWRSCRRCGSPDITPAQRRKYNYVCRACHATEQRDRYRKAHGATQPRISVEAVLLAAIERHGLPTTINEMSAVTGIPKRICASRVCDLIADGVLRRTGGRVRYGNGGPSFCFEVASSAQQRQAIRRRNAERDALVEPGAMLHSKTTQMEMSP